MDIERVGRDDAAGLLALERASQERPLGLDALLHEVVAGGLVLLARDGSDRSGRPVGFASARPLADEVHVIRLVVAEADRRRGIGRALLAELVRWAVGIGATAVLLEVRASNTAALALYVADGFVIEGRRPGYYPDGEDALLLRLPLAAEPHRIGGQADR